MERNITPHAINGIAKILREKRELLIDWQEDDFDMGVESGKKQLLNELTLAFAEWFAKNGIDPNQFIERSGYDVQGSS